jgi:hypothetical protein
VRLLGAIFAILLILVVGGGLTAQIIANNNNPSACPVVEATDDPNASV